MPYVRVSSHGRATDTLNNKRILVYDRAMQFDLLRANSLAYMWTSPLPVQLLEQNNHSIAAVAEEVGILDVNYFTKIFKKTLGVTPTRYRREHKEK